MKENNYNKCQEHIKEKYKERRGYWRAWNDVLLDKYPEFLEKYANYAGYPAEKGPLDQRMIELIYVALDVSSNHLYEPGVKTHLKKAMEAGATSNDIIHLLHIVSWQGLSCVFEGASILVDELKGGLDVEKIASEHNEVDRKDQLERIKLAFPGGENNLEALSMLDPGYLDLVIDFISMAPSGGGLSDRERFVIETALHSSFTGFNQEGLRCAIRGALRSGSNFKELLQVIQLGAHLSVHGTALGANMIKFYE